MILSDSKNRFKIKQGTSWRGSVFLGGSKVRFVKDVLTWFWFCDGSFDVISKPYGGARSAEGAYDPEGGHGNKFKLLDITEE